MKLPTKKKPINTDPWAYTCLLYGPTKIGKTSFCAANDALFLCTEPGTEALSTYEIQITGWGDLFAASQALTKAYKAEEKLPYTSIVIDTIDNAWSFCQADVCRRLNIKHPSDASYGKGWDAVKREFRDTLLAFSRLPVGLWMISHSKTTTIETEGAPDYDRTTPTLPGSAREIVLGLCDMVLFADFHSEVKKGKVKQYRVIRTKPTASYDAGDRTGKLPEIISLDYYKFMKSFGEVFKNAPQVSPEAKLAGEK